MARSIRHYSDWLTSWAALVGVPTSRITTELAATGNVFFQSAMKRVWEAGPWLENTPRFEARFAGNQIEYPNNLANTTYWTATALTITANSLANPVDGRITASKLLESSATSAHSVVHSANDQVVSTSYQVTAYVRPNGRDWVYLKYADGSLDHTAFFNVTTGATGTATNCTATIGTQSNGYYLCQIQFTTSTSVTPTGAVTIQVSTDGSTLSYAGDTSKGLYVWGVLVQKVGNNSMNDYLIDWAQLGEEEIETVFNVYQTNPVAAQAPSLQGYELTPNGIQLVNGTWSSYYVNGVNQTNVYGSNPANPVYLYYRKQIPNWTGDDYSATATYAVDDQIYFTDSDGNGDYYKCIVATTAGQSPETNPTKWSVLPVYGTFYEPTLYYAFCSWLIADGQQDKAAGIQNMADDKLANEFDRLERQAGDVMPIKIQTHVSAQATTY